MLIRLSNKAVITFFSIVVQLLRNMSKGTKLTEFEKSQIQALNKNERNVSKISSKIQRSHKVIMNFLADLLNYSVKKNYRQ